MKVCVAGGGIAGLATAWALTKRGHEVTLIEQGAIPNPRAAQVTAINSAQRLDVVSPRLSKQETTRPSSPGSGRKPDL